jgi:hypothetical protein
MDFRAAIISQYHAALQMLKQAVLACPDPLWHNPEDANKFYQVAYHALYYTHLYLQDSVEAFQPWTGHREEYRLAQPVQSVPAPAVVLDYLAFCQRQVVEKVSTMDFETASGFHWLHFSKFELQIYSIRHIQHHAGELMQRLGPLAADLGWIGSYRPDQKARV